MAYNWTEKRMDKVRAVASGVLCGFLLSVAIMSTDPLEMLVCSSLGFAAGTTFLYYSWKFRTDDK